jgi:hypothetical protein
LIYKKFAPLPNFGENEVKVIKINMFQTKYCHSLKMHLRKYNHTRTPGIFDSDSHDEGKHTSLGRSVKRRHSSAIFISFSLDFNDNGRPESDDSTNNSLQQLAEQYNNVIGTSNEHEDPKGGLKPGEDGNAHPALNNILLQPIVTSASMQSYASQLLMRQQHVKFSASHSNFQKQ